jgi:Ankyrin repeats (3 copies)
VLLLLLLLLPQRLSSANFTIEVIVCALFAMAEAARLLESAFRNDDCKAIRLYVKRGYNCSAVDPVSECTLLHVVMRLRCTDCDKSSMAHSLIRGGNPVDARNKHGFTPLMIHTSPALATVLLDHGADVNACSGDGSSSRITCLTQAVANNNLPVVQLLLSRGAAIDAALMGCRTALQATCDFGYPAIAKALLAAGASVTDQQLVHAAVVSKQSADTQLELLRLLLQHGAPVDELDADGASPLIECICQDASYLIADVLLKAGADANAAKTGGVAGMQMMTALHFAAYVGSPDAIGVLKLLLAAGASTSSLCCNGCLPLHNALRDSSCTSSEVAYPLH